MDYNRDIMKAASITENSTDSAALSASSPSHARRMALRQADEQVVSKMTVSNQLPIEKYYDVSDRLYATLLFAMEERRLDDAYVLGIRFATFSINVLPKHASYKRQQALRMRNSERVQRVLQLVESVVERMDAEELVKLQQEKQRQQQMKEEEQKRKVQLEKEEKKRKEQRDKEEQKRKEEERKGVDKTQKVHRQQVEKSALAKLDALRNHQHGDEQRQQEKHREEVDTAPTSKDQATGKQQAEDEVILPGNKQMNHTKETKPEGRDLHHQMQVTPRHKEYTSEKLEVHGLRTDEERTILLLQETITIQEERIKDILEVKIPALLHKAKAKLAAGERKEALYCVYRKRKWEHNVEMLKAGIFKMETQILRLEAAAEDREVAKVMQEAADAMQAIQAHAGVTGEQVDDMNQVVAEIASGELVGHDGMMLNEEELLSELLTDDTESSTTPTQISDTEVPGLSQDLLSLPSTPTSPVENTVQTKKKTPSLLKPVVI